MSLRKAVRAAALVCSVLLLLLVSRAGGDALRISANGMISGYQSNPLTVEAPEAGTLTLEVRDDTTLYRVLEYQVPEGKSQVIWDGLGWNGERLARKVFRIGASLKGESGSAWTAETGVNVAAAKQAVLFALPSDPDVYTEEPSGWFLEYKLLYTDELTAEFFRADTDEMVLKAGRKVKGGRVNRITWGALLGKNRPEPGEYRVRVSGKEHPSASQEFTLRVNPGKRPELPLRVTGDIMPRRGDPDGVIWEKMTEPAVVIDIKNVAHQRVYTEPDYGSRVIGNLHGQSQTLAVLEIRDGWVRVQAWNHDRGEPVEGWVPRKVLKVVQPQTEYGLLVDKKAQTLTLYRRGEQVETLLVSTGRMAKGELYQETAAGSFLTDEHMADYSTNGLKYDFVIRYDGGNLLHQIPYAWSESGKKDMIPGEVYLGCKASHACIRIQQEPGEKGINAYWFWTHLPYHTRVIVLDDPEEREGAEKILTGNTPDLREGLKTAWQVEPEEKEEGKIVLTFGGDAVIGGRESYYGNPEGLPAYLEKNGYGWPFAGLRSVFEADDWTCVNLECVLKDNARGEDTEKAWRFRGLTAYAEALREGGIEMVNIANNHTIDYGAEGYESTLAALNGVAEVCGNGKNAVVEIGGRLFGFGGCRETAYCQDPGVIEADIRALREAGAEFVIYQCHWGTEYEEYHNALQEAMARACRRAGADLVIGHHPHVVQGIGWIDGMPVVYSLGNLSFGGTIRLSGYDGLVVQANFYPDRETDRVQLKLIPVLTSSSADRRINDYQPRPAAGEDALRILEKVQRDTPFPLTERFSLRY